MLCSVHSGHPICRREHLSFSQSSLQSGPSVINKVQEPQDLSAQLPILRIDCILEQSDGISIHTVVVELVQIV